MLTTSDIPFRMICKEFGAGLTTTEMVSATGLLARKSASYRYAVLDESERPAAIQILTSTPDATERAIHALLPHRPSMFDLNAGCPSERVCEAGCGAELLDDLPRLHRVVSAAVHASDIPVSVKVRAQGFSSVNAVEAIAKTVEDAGAAMLTVHGRIRHAEYSTGAQWDAIARAKSVVSIPVIGNGDVFSSADAEEMFRQTHCDAVMIARGSLGTPWIFRDIRERRNAGITEYAPSHAELGNIVDRHLHTLLRDFGPVHALPRMRKHFLWYIRWYVNFDTCRKNIFLREDAHFILDTVRHFFEHPQERYPSDSREFQEIEKRFRNRVLFWTLPVQSAVPL